MKDRKYELIWSLILIVVGIIVSALGYIIYPYIILVLLIGAILVLIGVLNAIKGIFFIKKK